MTRLYKNVFLFLLMVLFSTINAQEPVKKYADNTLSEVTYAMSHPMHDWEGVNKNVRAVIKENSETGKIEKAAVSLKIIDFNSGNSNRDSHAVEILDGIKYPAITFVSNRIEQTENNIRVTGILNFHNVKKKITFSVLKKEKKGKDVYIGSFDVDMTEYNIKRPTLMNMPTDKIIKISFLLVF
ncbi:MAG: YceI family protein [Bacteroidetes bacterium]|nr:MAG: YceI family protein [Bacteroidota bacterium]